MKDSVIPPSRALPQIPFSLFDTYFPASADRGLRTPFAHGYELVDRSRTDVTDVNASATGMSGSLVATREDITEFLTALLDGRIVPAPQLAQMMQTVPRPDGAGAPERGLGLDKISLPVRCHGVVARRRRSRLPQHHGHDRGRSGHLDDAHPVTGDDARVHRPT